MRSVPFLLSFAAVVALGCSSTNGGSPPPGQTGDDVGAGDASPGDADADAGTPCASEQATPDQACGTLSWSTAPTQSRLRNHHLTFAVPTTGGGTSLVVVGGFNDMSLLANVDVVPIQADGTLGTFSAGPALPIAVGGATGEFIGGVLVVAGGQSRLGMQRTTFTSVVAADGTLGPWKQQALLSTPKMHAGSFTVGKRMYIMGGFSYDPAKQASTVYDDVIAGDVGADGTIAAFTQVGKLPQVWTHMAVSEAAGTVYVTGGLHGDPYSAAPVVVDVYSAQVQADGTVGGWTAQNKLPVPLATHSSFVYGGWLYEVGGIDDAGDEMRQVWRAPIQADHSLGAWEKAALLPLGRGHVHKLPIVNDRVYSVSGAIDGYLNSTPDIFIGSFGQ
jgi:hypothetical protein